MLVVALVVETYEADTPDFPVVRHEFMGRNQQEAIDVFHAHLKFDQFLAACVQGDFRGMKCHSVSSWKRYTT